MLEFTRHPCRLVTLSALLAGVLLVAGCRTETATVPPNHLASVTIPGYSEADILRAMQAVFLAHGYQHIADLDFDKKGSPWQTALYGGWAAGGVWIRMKASLDPGPNGAY